MTSLIGEHKDINTFQQLSGNKQDSVEASQEHQYEDVVKMKSNLPVVHSLGLVSWGRSLPLMLRSKLLSQTNFAKGLTAPSLAEDICAEGLDECLSSLLSNLRNMQVCNF
jgi:hypothetical protein